MIQTTEPSGGSVAVERDKHVGVYHATQEIDSVVRELESLLARISAPLPMEPEPSKLDRADPSLAEFLNGGASDIRSKLDSAHHLIKGIHEQLF